MHFSTAQWPPEPACLLLIFTIKDCYLLTRDGKIASGGGDREGGSRETPAALLRGLTSLPCRRGAGSGAQGFAPDNMHTPRPVPRMCFVRGSDALALSFFLHPHSACQGIECGVRTRTQVLTLWEVCTLPCALRGDSCGGTVWVLRGLMALDSGSVPEELQEHEL